MDFDNEQSQEDFDEDEGFEMDEDYL